MSEFYLENPINIKIGTLKQSMLISNKDDCILQKLTFKYYTLKLL